MEITGMRQQLLDVIDHLPEEAIKELLSFAQLKKLVTDLENDKTVFLFNELRKIKDSLPDGSMKKIAAELNVSTDTVRNYFGGANYERGASVGVHYEQGGPDGGIVQIDDTKILELAQRILAEQNSNIMESLQAMLKAN